MPVEGHDKQCPLCGERTNSLAANPGLWPVPLHSDQPGVVGWWHAGCAINQIERVKKLEAALVRLRDIAREALAD